jgi:hypothetical protein
MQAAPLQNGCQRSAQPAPYVYILPRYIYTYMYMYMYMYICTHTHTHTHTHTYGLVEGACSVAREFDEDVDVVGVDALCHR